VHRSQVLRTDFTRGLSETVASTASGPGQFEAHDSDNILAHEFGHLMGLHDEYTDKYRYKVVDADGREVNGSKYIDVDEWYKNGEAMKAALPSGHKIVFEPGGYGAWLHGVRNSDAENDSLMAYVVPGASVKQMHVDAIFAQTRLTCPDKCCCGDGKVDGAKGEQCDPKASPNGCATFYACSSCKCRATFRCGDGNVTGPEKCDYKASPTGCKTGEECTADCLCKAIPKAQETEDDKGSQDDQPPAGPPAITTLDLVLVNPQDGAEIMGPEPVIIEYNDPELVLLIEYFIDDELVYQSQDPHYHWMLEPHLYPPGEHEFGIKVDDKEWVEIRRSITIETYGG